MYIRSKSNNNQLLDGTPILEHNRPELYPTAYPFKVCNKGGVGKVAFVSINGQNPAVAASLVDVADANVNRVYPTAAFTVAVSSASATDTAAGTGAQAVEVDVLDTNYNLYTLSFELAGQTKVADIVLGANALRINDIRITRWGTGLANVGVVYVYDSSDTVTGGVPQTPAKIFGRVLVGANVSRGAFYTVPAGCKLQLERIRAGVNDNTTTARAGSLAIKTFMPIGGRLIPSSIFVSGQINNTAPPIACEPAYPLVFDEKTDIVFQAQMSAASVITLCADAVLFYK
jgi:hypothetical protein